MLCTDVPSVLMSVTVCIDLYVIQSALMSDMVCTFFIIYAVLMSDLMCTDLIRLVLMSVCTEV